MKEEQKDTHAMQTRNENRQAKPQPRHSQQPQPATLPLNKVNSHRRHRARNTKHRTRDNATRRAVGPDIVVAGRDEAREALLEPRMGLGREGGEDARVWVGGAEVCGVEGGEEGAGDGELVGCVRGEEGLLCAGVGEGEGGGREGLVGEPGDGGRGEDLRVM